MSEGAKEIELTARLEHIDREDVAPQTFKLIEVNSSTGTVSWSSKALIEVKIFTEREVRTVFSSVHLSNFIIVMMIFFYIDFFHPLEWEGDLQ